MLFPTYDTLPLIPFSLNPSLPVAPTLLQGALLLVLFQTSHTLEHLLTHKAQGNLQALYDTIPTSAVVVKVRQCLL